MARIRPILVPEHKYDSCSSRLNEFYMKILLQIFSKTVIGPIFFEFIQRKGDDGFGEGNFKALFESIEADELAKGEYSKEVAAN